MAPKAAPSASPGLRNGTQTNAMEPSGPPQRSSSKEKATSRSSAKKVAVKKKVTVTDTKTKGELSKLEEQIDMNIVIRDDFFEFEGVAVAVAVAEQAKENKEPQTNASALLAKPKKDDPLQKVASWLVKEYKKPTDAFKALKKAVDNKEMTTELLQDAIVKLKVPVKELTGNDNIKDVVKVHPRGDGKGIYWKGEDLFLQQVFLEQQFLKTLTKDSPIVKLREYLLSRFKSSIKAFRAVDTNYGGTVTYGEMEEAFDRLRVPWRDLTGIEQMKHVFKGHPKAKVGEFERLDIFGEDYADEEDCNSEDDVPFFEQCFNNKDAVLAFAQWAAFDNRWSTLGGLFHNPNGPKQLGVITRQDVSVKTWYATCTLLSYPGDSKEIFQEIKDQCLSMREKSNRRKVPAPDIIHPRQFRQFERLARMLDGQVDAEDSQSAVGRLVKVLVKREGSFIRGWRQHVDAYGNGQVCHKVFVQSLRGLGLQAQVKTIWNSLRKSGNHDVLRIHELCGDEAENLECFVDLLWERFGLNLDQAWDSIDVNHQNCVGVEEFRCALDKMDFEGDATLLFRGLGDWRVNRLSPEDFMYIGKVSQQYRERLNPTVLMVHPFITWAQCSHGGAAELMPKLGFSEDNPVKGVGDLAARITSLGYTGDALAVATKAARLEGGCEVTALSLHLLLSGERRLPAGKSSSPMIMVTKKSPSKQSPEQPKAAWNNRVYDFATANTAGSNSMGTPRRNRLYFGGAHLQSPQTQAGGCKSPRSSPTKPSRPSRVATPLRSQSASTVRRHTIAGNEEEHKYRREIVSRRGKALDDTHLSEMNKKAWNGHVHNASNNNRSKTKHMKDYFTEDSREVRSQIQEKMAKTEQKRKAAMQSRNRTVFKRFMAESSLNLQVGEKVLMAIKLQIDASKERTGHFLAQLDEDGSGELDNEELRQALEKLGFELDDDSFQAMVDLIDEDGGGTISLKELIRAMRHTNNKVEKVQAKALAQMQALMRDNLTINLPNGQVFEPLSPRSPRKDSLGNLLSPRSPRKGSPGDFSYLDVSSIQTEIPQTTPRKSPRPPMFGLEEI